MYAQVTSVSAFSIHSSFFWKRFPVRVFLDKNQLFDSRKHFQIVNGDQQPFSVVQGPFPVIQFLYGHWEFLFDALKFFPLCLAEDDLKNVMVPVQVYRYDCFSALTEFDTGNVIKHAGGFVKAVLAAQKCCNFQSCFFKFGHCKSFLYVSNILRKKTGTGNMPSQGSTSGWMKGA